MQAVLLSTTRSKLTAISLRHVKYIIHKKPDNEDMSVGLPIMCILTLP
jgi:hypothetical protein